MFSMHSHSGQFCPGHAKDQLEEVILKAISLKMPLFALTEHMPRTRDTDLYPEEISSGSTISELLPRHEEYVVEAVRLRGKYKAQIKILIGFEAEWIRPDYAVLINQLFSNPAVDYFVGSVHHVHEIPIDYDRAMYASARKQAGGTDERLFADYFDSQFEMLTTLKPRVVGHFDLIRLYSSDPDRDLRGMEGVWDRVVRNLRIVVEYGGLVEVNSSALRKGMREPYPGRSVVEEFKGMEGSFTLSDDSHGIAQVGLNLQRTIEYLETVGVEKLGYLERREDAGELVVEYVPLAEVKNGKW